MVESALKRTVEAALLFKVCVGAAALVEPPSVLAVCASEGSELFHKHQLNADSRNFIDFVWDSFSFSVNNCRPGSTLLLVLLALHIYSSLSMIGFSTFTAPAEGRAVRATQSLSLWFPCSVTEHQFLITQQHLLFCCVPPLVYFPLPDRRSEAFDCLTSWWLSPSTSLRGFFLRRNSTRHI